ncbi:hypothetical protein KR100_10455 [Synechococcus sp. KORDI-100]|uniref:sugar phosphate isomerase/epimerase family protein n=1 Tax=Synechococcus sp. KORDI-100 TaxID=1280380 RepID=UPI0004E0A81F|nr:xylose isomerase [Synechococcus sp. KORDI-100]AII43780.1 hypothetical protein KR100_10455 [Synechococcus sp. KORDI-100]
MCPTELLLFQTLWGWRGSFDQALQRSGATGFDGIEINLDHPCLETVSSSDLLEALRRFDQALILEIITGGDYTPNLGDSPDQHLEQLDRALNRAGPLLPLKINLITGSDSWTDPEQNDFLEAVLDRLEQVSCPVMLETHRSRSLFNPWRLPFWLQQHPRLRLTADLSHWCAVSERLMTPDLKPIQAMASHVDHIHARVGHAQGPSVSHPFAPEWAEALEAHRLCWQLFLDRRGSKADPITITPEFGPDGYMPTVPFSAEPLADVDAINVAMTSWLRTTMRL